MDMPHVTLAVSIQPTALTSMGGDAVEFLIASNPGEPPKSIAKTASGRSAPEWIDSYVILEAKNLLKYSDITIKEIVYRLNFPNQSVFYKFFKARTGMTPSEYRNS